MVSAHTEQCYRPVIADRDKRSVPPGLKPKVCCAAFYDSQQRHFTLLRKAKGHSYAGVYKSALAHASVALVQTNTFFFLEISDPTGDPNKSF